LLKLNHPRHRLWPWQSLLDSRHPSTFRDWCAESTNHPRELAEAALVHVVSDQTEAAYLARRSAGTAPQADGAMGSVPR